MNFQNIEYFLAAAKEKNITRAAEKLNISQQALSNNIARLESSLGCRLFERGQSLDLTYSGQKYLEAAERMLDLHRQTLNLLNDINKNIRGELRLGISYTRGQAILPLVLPGFINKYPQVELTVIEGSTKALESLLEHGDIDVMIGFAPFMFKGAKYYELMRERLYLVISKALILAHFENESNVASILQEFRENHNLRLFQDFPFVLLREGDRIRTVVNKAFAEAGFKPNIKLETRNTQTAVALAAEGVGITMCPELYLHSHYTAAGPTDSYIRERIDILPLFEEPTSGQIAIGYNKERYLSDIASDFIAMCREKLS